MGGFSGASCTAALKASASSAFCTDRAASQPPAATSPAPLEPLLCQSVGTPCGSGVRSVDLRTSLLTFPAQLCHFVSH